MFDKFGEFDSAEELNRAAKAQLEEGDMEALLALAMENGLDREDAEDYADGVLEELTTPLMAAVGKLNIEKEEYKLQGVLADWADEIAAMCGEDPAMCRAVRRKGKGLAGYLAVLTEKGYENRVVVDRRIVDLTKQVRIIVGTHELCIGILDQRSRREEARRYYLGEEADG